MGEFVLVKELTDKEFKLTRTLHHLINCVKHLPLLIRGSGYRKIYKCPKLMELQRGHANDLQCCHGLKKSSYEKQGKGCKNFTSHLVDQFAKTAAGAHE